ncbi:MAG: glutamine-hydrolyzing carbamoyl-phosphate synthase small subunit [Verrucomicrobiota bacterium]|jgi:carbamoyl-phosphate synthase small subunit|nr:glutamine-hydrolyzing carbamoyl-phosphate synthase small subunit [Verrucomicrobiota bacterium]
MKTQTVHGARQREKKAFLALADATIFRGWSCGAPVDRLGEVVFNTGMTGYQEILTDPSYAGQFIAFTAPEMGNTGFNREDMESNALQASGLLLREMNPPSNWRSEESLETALLRWNTPAIAGVDTRALTLKLRDGGTQKGFLCTTGTMPEAEAVEQARAWVGLDGQDYASIVTTKCPYEWQRQNAGVVSHPLVAVLDYGVKFNTLRQLSAHGFHVQVFPARTTAEDVLQLHPAGVLLSNGPADPAALGYAVKTVQKLLGRVPLMGICLGHQLLALALGGRTRRLKFGHHGCNHPVQDLRTGMVEITSQNHNYVVEADSLDPTLAEITHISLNDRTVEGLACKAFPAFSLQYHPEAAPGPHDAMPAFERFTRML